MTYIKKEPIIDFIKNGLNNPDKDKAFGYDAIEILAEIEYMPTAELVEVPCKIGSTIYRVNPYTHGIFKYEVVGFHIGEFPTLNGHKRNPYLVCYNKDSKGLKHIPIKDIGKIAFFDIEEAKKSIESDTQYEKDV